MQTISSVLLDGPDRHPGAGPAEVISFTSRDSDRVYAVCGGTGWLRAESEEFIGFRRCACVKARIQAERLVVPELFRAPRSIRTGPTASGRSVRWP